MKKYIFLSIIFTLLFSLNINFSQASDLGCVGAGLYSTTTGKLCPVVEVVKCPVGDLFSTVTGQRCNAWQENILSNTLQEFQIGSRGDGVKTFQQILVNKGFLFGKIDGIYGPITDAAAKNYYKKYPKPLPPTFSPETISTPSPNPKPSPSPLLVVKTEPQISYLSPEEGSVGTQVNIYGTGLLDSTIYFGGHPVNSARIDYSDDDNQISFAVPTNFNNCHDRQMCTMVYKPVTDGKYYVYVVNKNGTSNSLIFTVVGSTVNR